MVFVLGQEKSDFWTHIGGLGEYKSERKSNSEGSELVRLFQCFNTYSNFKGML